MQSIAPSYTKMDKTLFLRTLCFVDEGRDSGSWRIPL